MNARRDTHQDQSWGYKKQDNLGLFASGTNQQEKSHAERALFDRDKSGEGDVAIERIVANELLIEGCSSNPMVIGQIAQSIALNGGGTQNARQIVQELNTAAAALRANPRATVVVSGPASAALETIRDHMVASNQTILQHANIISEEQLGAHGSHISASAAQGIMGMSTASLAATQASVKSTKEQIKFDPTRVDHNTITGQEAASPPSVGQKKAKAEGVSMLG